MLLDWKVKLGHSGPEFSNEGPRTGTMETQTLTDMGNEANRQGFTMPRHIIHGETDIVEEQAEIGRVRAKLCIARAKFHNVFYA